MRPLPRWRAVAYIMSQKYTEAMPLYRIKKHFECLGVELPRAVMSNWVLKSGEMLEPVYNCLRYRPLELPILRADETTLQVLEESGRRAQSKSYTWPCRSGRDGPPIVCYEYQPTRNGENPKRFLADFAVTSASLALPRQRFPHDSVSDPASKHRPQAQRQEPGNCAVFCRG